jgi:cytochrome c6
VECKPQFETDKQTSLMKKTLILATLCFFAVGATARAADVKENWDKQCAKCHGADGKGDTKMGKKLEVKDYTDAKVQAAMKDDEMAKIIKQGKKEGDKTKMKAFTELSDAEIKALVAHVRSLKK